ncbi:hypothetical protein FRC17_010765, partial [Serendipita sp. 399]
MGKKKRADNNSGNNKSTNGEKVPVRTSLSADGVPPAPTTTTATAAAPGSSALPDQHPAALGNETDGPIENGTVEKEEEVDKSVEADRQKEKGNVA